MRLGQWDKQYNECVSCVLMRGHYNIIMRDEFLQGLDCVINLQAHTGNYKDSKHYILWRWFKVSASILEKVCINQPGLNSSGKASSFRHTVSLMLG